MYIICDNDVNAICCMMLVSSICWFRKTDEVQWLMFPDWCRCFGFASVLWHCWQCKCKSSYL